MYVKLSPEVLKHKNKDWLQQKHHVEKLSTREIALSLGVDHKTVIYWMKKFGVQRNDRESMSREKMLRGSNHQNYGKKGALSACFGRKHTAEELGKMKKLSNGENNKMWNGGRCYHSDGYVWINAPEHPFANNNNYVLEHRLVMEKKLGRYLQPEEVVHHINGKKDDNRPENLKLFPSKSEHARHHVKLRMMKEGISI